MADVTVDVSGEMETPAPETSGFKLSSILNPRTALPSMTTWVLARRHSIRPWTLFLQTSSFKPPTNLSRLSKRLMKNIEYFQSNYLFVFLILIAYCLITSPLLLLAIGASLFAGYKLQQRHSVKNYRLLGKELTTAQIYGLVATCSLPIFYIAGAGSAIFWVIGASCFVISLHAAFYNIDSIDPEDENFHLTMDEIEQV